MKTVLITGASGNLGKAAVAKFLSDGYKVVTTYSPGKGHPATKDVEGFEADLTNEKSAEAAVRGILEKHKTLDAALLLVGGFAMGNIGNTDGAALKKMFSLNFETAYYVARPVFEQMLRQPEGGKIVLIGSRPPLVPKEAKSKLAYALSKSLIFQLAEALTAEGSSKNVTASVIAPSIIDTEENRQSMPDADYSTWVKPEEIAEAMAYLCSEKGRALRDTVLKMYGRA